MKNNNPKQITVFKNQQSLLDIINYLNDTNEKTGELSDKICFVINNHKGTGHSQKFVSFYMNREEVKLLSFDIFSGSFASNIYQKEKGIYQKFGGGKYSRILNIKSDGTRYTFTITISEAIQGPNGTVKPGKQIDQHSVMISDFETRKLFKTLHDFIDKVELVRALNGVQVQREDIIINEELPVHGEVTLSPANNEEETFNIVNEILSSNGASDDILEAFNEFGQGTYEEETPNDNDPILPSGKFKGQRLSEMNDGYKKWILENAKGQAWEPIKDAIRRTLA